MFIYNKYYSYSSDIHTNLIDTCIIQIHKHTHTQSYIINLMSLSIKEKYCRGLRDGSVIKKHWLVLPKNKGSISSAHMVAHNHLELPSQNWFQLWTLWALHACVIKHSCNTHKIKIKTPKKKKNPKGTAAASGSHASYYLLLIFFLHHFPPGFNGPSSSVFFFFPLRAFWIFDTALRCSCASNLLRHTSNPSCSILPLFSQYFLQIL